MACVAAGLAAYGFVPFIHSFAPFASRRIFDQIAVSIAYGGNNVKIIGSDPGIAAELNGGTHMSFEDVAAMRAIPGMLIFEPVDARQMEEAMPAIVEYDGPVYVRMFRKETPDVFTEPDYKFNLFKADVLREGTDVSIFVTGLLTSDALRAADMLREEGVSAEVINIHTLKPVDRQAILKSVKKTGRALTVENHSVFGGLHSGCLRNSLRGISRQMRRRRRQRQIRRGGQAQRAETVLRAYRQRYSGQGKDLALKTTGVAL